MRDGDGLFDELTGIAAEGLRKAEAATTDDTASVTTLNPPPPGAWPRPRDARGRRSCASAA